MFFTWAARARENRIRFVGDAGAIEWTGGELRLERAGAVERLDYSAELEKTAVHRRVAGLFSGIVAALHRGGPGVVAGGPSPGGRRGGRGRARDSSGAPPD